MKSSRIKIVALANRQLETLSVAYSFYESAFGKTLIASADDGICYIGFGDEPNMLADFRKRFPTAPPQDSKTDVQKTALAIINGKACSNEIVLYVAATEFRLKVWNRLLQIPYGKVSTYAAIAKEIDRPNAARAVGNAVGANPVSYLIPCHRVIRSDKTLGGYFWGSHVKEKILNQEQEI